jgi:hypothetical protein
MSAPTSATTEVPSRTLTNKSVDEDAIPGEDTSEVGIELGDMESQQLTNLAGHEALCGAITSMEACRRVS